MNILYIDHYAGSLQMGMEFRPYYFAKEWEKMGHKVRIVGASFSHLRKTNPEVDKDFEIQQIEGVEFQWIKTRTYEGNGVARAITMAEFCGKLQAKASSIAREFNPDVIIASSTYPLDTFPAQKIKKYSKNAILVHEIHDMWPLTPIEMYGMSPKHPFVVAMQIGENSFCRHSDKVVSVLPGAQDYLVEHGMRRDKFVYVPNGIILDDWNSPEELPQEHKAILQKAKAEGRFVLGFFGSHTRSYNLDTLLEASKKIEPGKLFLVFVGSGIYKDELRKMAKELALDENSYAFLPPIPKKSVPSLIQELDASYVSIQKNGLNRFGIGMNKLFDAMMGGKPLLYAVEAYNDFAKEYDCGVSVEAENVEALEKGIRSLMEMPSEERERKGQNGRNAVLEHFNYPVLANKFIEAFK